MSRSKLLLLNVLLDIVLIIPNVVVGLMGVFHWYTIASICFVALMGIIALILLIKELNEVEETLYKLKDQKWFFKSIIRQTYGDSYKDIKWVINRVENRLSYKETIKNNKRAKRWLKKITKLQGKRK